MGRVRCFFLESTGRTRVQLRRYSSPNERSCETQGYHNALVFLEDEPEVRDSEGYVANGIKPAPPHDDPRWPIACACGYTFQENDEWQRFTERIYRRADTREEMTLRDAPVGAMWYAEWLDWAHAPQCGHNLVVRTPGGEWNIDSQASNCTMPDDSKQEHHHCWIRHGEPPNITVDKQGVTCGAGAGSIQCGQYHGFLRNGYLEE